MGVDFLCGWSVLICRHVLVKIRTNNSVKCLSTLPEKIEPPSLSELNSADDDIESPADPGEVALSERYDKVKDLSRIKNWHKCLLHGQITPPDEFKWQQERWAQKARYAKYGRESGVDPGLMWPTRSELREKISEEERWSPKLAETIRAYKDRTKAQERANEQRIKAVDANLAKYPNMMKAYLRAIEDRRRAIKEANEQRAAKIREIKDSFGYAILESDPRFKVKMMMKRDEEKTASSLARRNQRKAKMLEQLQSFTASLTSQLAPDSQTASKPEENSGKTNSPVK